MTMGKKEIEKIYVVRDAAPDGSKYISQILIEYTDKKVKYFSLSPSDLKKSFKEQKAKEKMDEHLKKIVNGLEKGDYQKLVFVSDHNQDLREYVDHEIQIEKAKSSKKAETFSQMATTFQTLSSLGMILSPLHGTTNIVFSSAAALGMSSAAIGINQKRNKLPQVEAEWIRNLRFGFSMTLLGLNATLGITNFALSLDETKQDQYEYVLQEEKDDIVEKRRLIIEGLDNPFESDTMFTPADAATNVLMEAFDLNPLIEEEDREVASHLRQYLVENTYLDYERLYDDFSSFCIIDTNDTRGNVLASNFDDYIVVYNRDNISKEEYSENLEHELVHRTGHLNCVMLNEGMTSLITSEYMEDFQSTTAYYDEILMTKIFCELITPDKMLEAYSKEDMNIIKNEMLKLNPEEDKYQQFINLLNSYSRERESYVESGTLRSFFHEGHALEYQDKFAMMVMEYMYNANFDEAKVSRITEYLKAIGSANHFTIPGAIYFNQSAKELSYENAYSSELTETSSYHY